MCKTSINKCYERKGRKYLPHEVLDFLPNPNDYPVGYPLKKVLKDYDGDMIKMGSERYYVFKDSLSCCECNITGAYFVKERHLDRHMRPVNSSYHFNLYAINEQGQEVLMTKDHIIPKSKGGANHISNYTTMCTFCNGNKSNNI